LETTYKVLKNTINLEGVNDYVDIWFFGDVHRFTPSCDTERWKWFLKKAAQGDPNKTYYFGMGDYNEFAATGEKRIMTGEKIHETTLQKFDELAERENRAFASEIKQMRGKLLGLVHGNHSWNFLNGKNSTEDLAERMGCEYLGWLCYYHLTLMIGNKAVTADFVLCHGKAGGKLKGNSINQVTDLKSIFPLATVYCMGHNHDRGAWPDSVLYWDSQTGAIKQKRQFYCRSGSFKRAYTPDTSGYEIGRLLRPADLGAIKLRFSVHREQKNNEDRMILYIESVV